MKLMKIDFMNGTIRLAKASGGPPLTITPGKYFHERFHAMMKIESVYTCCLKKCLRQLTAFQADRICQLYKLNISDSRVPQGLCELCRTTLCRKQEGKEVVLPSLFNFKSIQVRSQTRGTMCYCLICQIGRSKLQEKHPVEEQTTIEKEPCVHCSTCLSSLGKGLSHQ